MRFPHPKGNIPIRMRQRGQPGITIDRSTDTVSIFHYDWQNSTWASCWQCPYTGPFLWRQATWQASLGTGSLPPGWEKGLAGSCVGERRWTSCQSLICVTLSLVLSWSSCYHVTILIKVLLITAILLQDASPLPQHGFWRGRHLPQDPRQCKFCATVVK